MTHRTWGKPDAVQDAIVDGLIALGYKVQIMTALGMGAPDLLVRTPLQSWVVLEVKSPGGALRPSQKKWVEHYGEVPVVETLGEALEALKGW